MRAPLYVVEEFLCRLGLHSWSKNRGGIQICTREGCRKATTFGITGAMRRLQFQEELYEQYESFEEQDNG